jgi:hypothetical protein
MMQLNCWSHYQVYVGNCFFVVAQVQQTGGTITKRKSQCCGLQRKYFKSINLHFRIDCCSVKKDFSNSSKFIIIIAYKENTYVSRKFIFSKRKPYFHLKGVLL